MTLRAPCLLLLSLAACIAQTGLSEDVRILCETQSDCPQDYTCSGGFCVLPGTRPPSLVLQAVGGEESGFPRALARVHIGVATTNAVGAITFELEFATDCAAAGALGGWKPATLASERTVSSPSLLGSWTLIWDAQLDAASSELEPVTLDANADDLPDQNAVGDCRRVRVRARATNDRGLVSEWAESGDFAIGNWPAAGTLRVPGGVAR